MKMKLKVIVTGPRDWGRDAAEIDVLEQALDAALQAAYGFGCGGLIVVHGAARGADEIAARWADGADGAESKPYPAPWRDMTSPTYSRSKGYDPAAGMKRNRRMAAENLDADFVLACKRGGIWTRGTGDMVEVSEANGLTVLVVPAPWVVSV